MVNAPTLTEFDQDICAPGGGNVAGISRIQVLRRDDIISMPSCTCLSGGTVTGNIFLKAGALVTTLDFEADGLGWKQDEIDSPHLSFYRHTIIGNRDKVSPTLMSALMRLRLGRFVLLLTDYNGWQWIIGNTSTPVTFRSSTEISPARAGTNQGVFSFFCDALRAACSLVGKAIAIDCSSVTAAEFDTYGFTYNGSDEFIGIPVPTIVSGSVVATIDTFDDGTIQQTTGGSYVDGLTETGGSYEPDGGAVMLTPGTYQVTMPMSITLIDGTTCGFTLTYPIIYTVGCGDVTNDDFTTPTFDFDGSGDFTGFTAPAVDAGIVTTITTYDDGTIQQISGGSYVDTITETGGIYAPDAGPATLTPGTYRITVPMSITLNTGATCAFTYIQDIEVGSSLFDPDTFDSNIFA
jgi:hypothetical protein